MGIRLAVAGACIAVVSACASGSGSAATVTGESAGDAANAGDDSSAIELESEADPTADSTDPEDSDGGELYVSPIGEALGVARDELAAAQDAYVRDAEELVRTCMADAGFDYQPVERGFDQFVRQAELQNSMSTEQFVAEYGFGIATLFELNFQGQGVIDFVNEQFGPPPAVQRSPGEQAAYEMALTGRTTQGLSAEEAQEQLFGNDLGDGAAALDGSCRNQGYAQAENPGAAYDGLFSLLGDEVEALTDRFDNDPRIRQERADWQSCMAAAGHAYESRSEITNELFDRTNELANTYLSSPQVLAGLGQAQQAGFVSMNSQERVAFLEDIGALQGFSWVPAVQASSDELIAFELRVAADSQACSNDDLFRQVQFELETEFVEAHADQLALIAAGDA